MEDETKGFLQDLEGDQNAGSSGLPVLAIEGAPPRAEYLFEATNMEVKFSQSEKNSGHPYISGRAEVLEPEDFEGESMYFMLWCPSTPDMDALPKDVRKAEEGQARFKGQVEAISGAEAFLDVRGNMEEVMEILAEMIDGQTFVGRLTYESLKKEQKEAGYQARAKIREYRAADRYGEESSD